MNSQFFLRSVNRLFKFYNVMRALGAALITKEEINKQLVILV